MKRADLVEGACYGTLIGLAIGMAFLFTAARADCTGCAPNPDGIVKQRCTSQWTLPDGSRVCLDGPSANRFDELIDAVTECYLQNSRPRPKP